jgi:hypothetical protein
MLQSPMNLRSSSYLVPALGLFALVACGSSYEEALGESHEAISCTDAPQWAAPNAVYVVGTQVKNYGHRYSCKVEGWCRQGGPYEPGKGWAAADAWLDLGACDAGTGGTGSGGTGGTGGTGGAGAAGSSGSSGAGGTPQKVCVNQASAAVSCGATCTTVANNGPPANRVALTMMGEGFTKAENASKFAPHVAAFRKYIFEDKIESEPYVRYKRFINLYRIDLVSNQSGIDDHEQGIELDTALDGEKGCTDYTIGQCGVNWEKAHNAFDAALKNSAVARPDWRMIALNSPLFCGDTHYPARGNLMVYCPFYSSSLDVALHEGGHAWHWLGDTYWTNDETYTGPEFVTEANLTTDPTGAKWKQWLGFNDPILGKIGAYAGGAQYPRGVYRPSNFSKMGGPATDVFCHEPGPPYCPHDAVSREKIILDIYARVRPFDKFLGNATLLVNPAKLWVDVVDCDVVKVDWYVDGKLVRSNFGEEFVPSQNGVTKGTHKVEARAYDDTAWVRLDKTSMKQTVTWNIRID